MIRKKTILYVDDDADDRIFLQEAIKQRGPEVDVVLAENGLEALQYLGAKNTSGTNLPCLIVLDINMPFLDGKETFKRLKENEQLKQVPVIVFSSSEKPADRLLFNSLGVEYFVKPFDIHYLHDIAGHMVEVCSDCNNQLLQ